MSLPSPRLSVPRDVTERLDVEPVESFQCYDVNSDEHGEEQVSGLPADRLFGFELRDPRAENTADRKKTLLILAIVMLV